MKTTNLYALLLALPLLVAATGESFAWMKTGFAGTRDQVRAACGKVGGSLEEGAGYTTCSNDKNGTVVQCDDSGNCAGGGPGPGPAPRIRIGMNDVVGAAIGMAARMAPSAPAESLTSGNSGGSTGGSDGGASGNAGGLDAGDIGQWHANTGGGIFVVN